MNPWLGILCVLGVLGLLLGVLRCFQSRLSPELSRKAVHVGMGFVCLSFPWLFREAWPVVLLAVLAVITLGAVRLLPALRSRVGGVLCGVERHSLGEIYFPIAVAAVFLLAGGNVLLYVIPVLTLTLADSVGALIGVRYGYAHYRTDEGFKSAEGSIAFFTAAFLSCHIPLLLFSDTGRAESLLIGLTAGFIVMLLEAIAWRGQDNLIIPIGMYFLLSFYLPLNEWELLGRFLLVLALVLLVMLVRNRTTLSDSAILAGALSGYAVWAFGGRFWIFPPLLLFVIYVWLPSFPKSSRPVQNLHAVTRVMAGGLLWVGLAHVFDRDFLLPYLLCMAAHTGNIITARLRIVRERIPMRTVASIALLLASGAFLLLAAGGVALGLLSFRSLFWIPVAVAISITLFIPVWPPEHRDDQRLRIWLSETAIAILVSLLGLIP